MREPRRFLASWICILCGALPSPAHGSGAPADIAGGAPSAMPTVAVPGNRQPKLLAPASVTLTVGRPVQLVATAADPDPGDSLSLMVTGLPAGLSAVGGRQAGGERQVRIYGMLGAAAGSGSARALRWVARGPAGSDTAWTDLVVSSDPRSQTEVEAEVRDVIERIYEHGMPRVKARRLGAAALPVLAGILRDGALTQVWKNATAAIGYIGDPAYFDTLRSFVWDRFSGDVDIGAFRAIMMSQISLGVMASTSPPVLDYLEHCVNPDSWQTVKWYSGRDQGRRLGVEMSLFTLIALGYTDSERAAAILSRVLARPFDPQQVSVARESLDRIGKVRIRGIEPIWDEEDVLR